MAAEFLAAEAAGHDTDTAGAAGHAGPDAAGSQDSDGDQDNDGEGDGGPGELAAGDHTGAARTTGHADAAGSQDSDADQDNDGDGNGRLAWYGDSAYGTGDLRDAIEKAGHQAVIKPKPLQPPVEGGFTLDDFTVNPHDRTVTCPGSVTHPVTPSRNVTFGAACPHCPLRERCTKSKTGRTLILHQHDDLLRAARADWAARTGLREDYMKHRPNVERAVAQVATRRGRRIKLRYRGTAKNNAWLKRRTAALNLRNLIVRAWPPRRRLGADHLIGESLACPAGWPSQIQPDPARQPLTVLAGELDRRANGPARATAPSASHAGSPETAYFSKLLEAAKKVGSSWSRLPSPVFDDLG